MINFLLFFLLQNIFFTLFYTHKTKIFFFTVYTKIDPSIPLGYMLSRVTENDSVKKNFLAKNP